MIRQVPCYEIVCDEPGCETKTGDLGEFSCWMDEGQAIDDWINSDGQIDGDRAFCHKHTRPACVECDATLDVEPDGPAGDFYCPTHMPTEEKINGTRLAN